MENGTILGDRLRDLVDRVTRKTTAAVECWEMVGHLVIPVEATIGRRNLAVVEELIAGITLHLRESWGLGVDQSALQTHLAIMRGPAALLHHRCHSAIAFTLRLLETLEV